MLIQLPPRLQLDGVRAARFFTLLRSLYPGLAACEPRHASWFSAQGQALLGEFRLARVAADPSRIASSGDPGGWDGFRYYRLHGSPRMYYSAYSKEFLQAVAAELDRQQSPAWCIFDNTAGGAAIPDALALMRMLEPRPDGHPDR